MRIPPQAPNHRGAYGKLRDRGSIDFPLLGVAARVDLDERGLIEDADLVFVALQARPIRIKGLGDVLRGCDVGAADWETTLADACERAHKQCHPMPNIPGDPDYRRAMVPVYARHTLRAALAGTGPVHQL